MARNQGHSIQAEGFRGDLAGLSLPDIVQLTTSNGFSGCVTIQHEDRVGRIFVREGRVIHAEQGGRTGEPAFWDIMEWRSGHFGLQANVSTTAHTIQKSAQHLLMDALRVVDERRAGRPAPPPAAAPAPPEDGGRTLVDHVVTVPGVAGAVVVDRGGTCVCGGGTPEAEILAAQGAYLALLSERIGELLGGGTLRAAVARGDADHLLVLGGRNGHLGLRVAGAADLAAVEASVRKAAEENRPPPTPEAR